MINIPNMSCEEKGGIKKVYIFNPNDIVVTKGEVRVKRKYGKFKRQSIELILNNNLKYNR